MDELLQLAEALARSLGHATACVKLQCRCTCGAGTQQTQALYDYERWKRRHDEQLTSGA